MTEAQDLDSDASSYVDKEQFLCKYLDSDASS